MRTIEVGAVSAFTPCEKGATTHAGLSLRELGISGRNQVLTSYSEHRQAGDAKLEFRPPHDGSARCCASDHEGALKALPQETLGPRSFASETFRPGPPSLSNASTWDSARKSKFVALATQSIVGAHDWRTATGESHCALPKRPLHALAAGP